jgi:hypothetical protein
MWALSTTYIFNSHSLLSALWQVLLALGLLNCGLLTMVGVRLRKRNAQRLSSRSGKPLAGMGSTSLEPASFRPEIKPFATR